MNVRNTLVAASHSRTTTLDGSLPELLAALVETGIKALPH